MTPAGHEPAGHTHDSAGQTFSGRTLTGTGFDDDTGDSDPALMVALADLDDERTWVRAVSRARLLVPVVAAPGEVVQSGDLAADKTSDMALATLVAPDGQRALPVFSGMGTLAAWDSSARPVPVSASRAAQSAITQGCDLMVLDVAGPVTAVLRPSMMWALAQGRQDWLPPQDDPFVARAVQSALAVEAQVRSHELFAGEPAGEGILGVRLHLEPGLDQDQVAQLATRVGERLATDGEFRGRIDGLAFALA